MKSLNFRRAFARLRSKYSPNVSASKMQRVLETPSTLNIELTNNTTSGTVYAYITGQALDRNNAVVLLQSDGRTLYYPASPGAVGSDLAADCAIQLGAPGNRRTVTIPRIAGGRIWFSVNARLTFKLNPGPALVEPSISNPSDPNIDVSWDFCEFTFNSAQIYANITYVDFVCLPISLTLRTASGQTKHVTGTGADGLTQVCNGLRAQHARDNAGWDQLIINSRNGSGPRRAVSPNIGILLNANLFSSYWNSYVDQVWAKYANEPLTINTQAQWGDVQGRVNQSGALAFPRGSYGKPSARDIFSCSTGPFANNDAQMLAITPRLCAAFNRATLLAHAVQPNSPTESYYKNPVTNHYSRIVHEANLDRKGYAFPYDDVVPDGGGDISGAVFDGAPLLLSVAVGGNGARK